jgi:DNA-directed RNA polymerase specialized sigma24 family protein
MQLQGNQNADREGFQLFRRAIEERDEQAWAESAARYRPLLIAWASRYSASAPIRECYNDIADNAFARAWVALASKSFARFPTLAALLAYLRTCVISAVIDCARADMVFDRMSQLVVADDVVAPEQIMIDQLDRDELWRLASSAAQTVQERCILVASYLYNLPPLAILERYPHLFANVAEIYATKRNLLCRLRRYPELQQLYRERFSA